MSKAAITNETFGFRFTMGLPHNGFYLRSGARETRKQVAKRGGHSERQKADSAVVHEKAMAVLWF